MGRGHLLGAFVEAPLLSGTFGMELGSSWVLPGTSALSSHLAGQTCHVGLWLFNEAHPRGPGPRQGSLSSAGAC